MKISIPFWSDFNAQMKKRSNLRKEQISIPFWSDFNWIFLMRNYNYDEISIPFWSDFNEKKCVSGDAPGPDFNPILV